MKTMTTDQDPLTDHMQMRAIHQWRFFWMFDRDGKAEVLYRRRWNKDGVTHLDVEWGGLDHPRFSDDSRREFADAWKLHQDWKQAMQ